MAEMTIIALFFFPEGIQRIVSFLPAALLALSLGQVFLNNVQNKQHMCRQRTAVATRIQASCTLHAWGTAKQPPCESLLSPSSHLSQSTHQPSYRLVNAQN